MPGTCLSSMQAVETRVTPGMFLSTNLMFACLACVPSSWCHNSCLCAHGAQYMSDMADDEEGVPGTLNWHDEHGDPACLLS